ncbi:unnamed protein product [Penicillium viridicatum]
MAVKTITKSSLRHEGRRWLSAEGKLSLEFLEKFEQTFISQSAYESRTIHESLDIAWNLLRIYPRELLNRIPLSVLLMSSTFVPLARLLGRIPG